MYPWEAQKKRKKKLQQLLKDTGITMVKSRDTSIVLGCINSGLGDEKYIIKDEFGNILHKDLTENEAVELMAKYGDEATTKYPNLSKDDAITKHLDDLVRTKTIKKQLVDFIEGLRTKRKDIRPTAGNVIEGKNILSFAHNIKNTNLDTVIEGFHPLVKDWVKWAKKNAHWDLPDHHGLCAEIINVSKILWKNDRKGKYTIQEAQKLFESAISHAKKIRGKNSSANGEFIEACNSCNPFLKYFKITEVK